MAREWAGRARFQVVLDPNIVFSRSSHLMSVIMDDPRNEVPEWRVLVVEDADELLREDAKSRVGQALSRLLNLGDGILGQGMKVIVLITTNEPIQRLHPALLRPGRCLTEIEFRKFTAAECGGPEPLVGRHDRSAIQVHTAHRRLPRPQRPTMATRQPNQTHRTASSPVPERCTSGAVWLLLAKRNAKRNRSNQLGMHRLQRSQRRTPRRLSLERRTGA